MSGHNTIFAHWHNSSAICLRKRPKRKHMKSSTSDLSGFANLTIGDYQDIETIKCFLKVLWKLRLAKEPVFYPTCRVHAKTIKDSFTTLRASNFLFGSKTQTRKKLKKLSDSWFWMIHEIKRDE